MIKHDDTDQVYNEFGEFGVVRNSVYDVHISKVNRIRVIRMFPKPDPGTKDEDEDKYLSIRINVNPWTWYTQTEEYNQFDDFVKLWGTTFCSLTSLYLLVWEEMLSAINKMERQKRKK